MRSKGSTHSSSLTYKAREPYPPKKTRAQHALSQEGRMLSLGLVSPSVLLLGSDEAETTSL